LRIPLLRLLRIALLLHVRIGFAGLRLTPAVPVADAIVMIAPPPARVLATGLLEHEEAFARQRRLRGLLPLEAKHVALERSVEVADHVLALTRVLPHAVHGAGGK